MFLPSSREKLIDVAGAIVERCRSDAGMRAEFCRSMKQWRYTGSPDGNAAIVNRLEHHVDREASHLFSPSDLRFHIDFEHTYPQAILDQAEVAARALTREFERRDIDLMVARGVDAACTYGATLPKLVMSHGGITSQVVMPWQFGVYRPDKNSLSEQEAVVETNAITPFDFWRRVSHLPNAMDLFRRARSYARKNARQENADSYFHQVTLAGQSPVVQTDPPFSSQPGGLVNVMGDYGGASLAPEVEEELIVLHEIWVLDDEREDYTTIQLAEPDILIAPLMRRRNLFVPGYLPYGLIQPTPMHGNFWGRSSMADLLKLQNLLRDRMGDITKLMSLQYDRLLGFIGNTGMTDEAYDQGREAGWFSMEPGSDVKDLTPPLPKEAFADIQEIIKFMDEVSGMNNILSGEGEPGVRAGSHAQMLTRMASPRLRDKALLVERQCADLGDKVFQCMKAKEAKAYWTGEVMSQGNEFLLDQLPEDYRVVVDSHSSSPIYEDDHKDIAAFLAKFGAVDGEDLIDLLPVPRRDFLKERLRQRKKQEAEFMKQHPELLAEQMKHKKR